MPQRLTIVVFSTFSLPVFALELTLIDAGNMAVSHSFQLQSIQQSMAITYFSHKLSIREYLPTVSFTYSDSRQVRYNSADTDSLQLVPRPISSDIFSGDLTSYAVCIIF